MHNTQPWRLAIGDNRLQIRADWSRFLRIADPLGRQLHLSCGCAAFNARVSLAAQGYTCRVELLPDGPHSDVLVELVLDPLGGADAAVAALAGYLDVRQTNRGEFDSGPVDVSLSDRLSAAAAAEATLLSPVTDPARRAAVRQLDALAVEIDQSDAAFITELGHWLTSETDDRSDGLDRLAPAIRSIPGAVADAAAPDVTDLFILETASDDTRSWLRAGMALERLLLELSRAGLAVVPLMQVIEIPMTRDRLRTALELIGFPHVVLRVGYAPTRPPTRRRRLVDVVTDA